MPRSFLEVFHQALVRARARMWPADAPEPEYHLDAKPLSADALVDVVIQFNWDPLSQTDNVRVLKILDGGVRPTKVSGGRVGAGAVA
jgi:hypothetical protein